jgi:hypothetical protein
MTEHVPPYITKCVHLSMKLKLGISISSGGMNQIERYHTSAIQISEKGYFLIK